MSEPTALRLADALEVDKWHISGVTAQSAADELRRLSAENERLHQINQSHEMKLSVRGHELQIGDLKAANQELTNNLEKKSSAIQRIWKERDELRKMNGELLEALTALCESHSRFSGGVWDKARAAIARAEWEV